MTSCLKYAKWSNFIIIVLSAWYHWLPQADRCRAQRSRCDNEANRHKDTNADNAVAVATPSLHTRVSVCALGVFLLVEMCRIWGTLRYRGLSVHHTTCPPPPSLDWLNGWWLETASFPSFPGLPSDILCLNLLYLLDPDTEIVRLGFRLHSGFQ